MSDLFRVKGMAFAGLSIMNGALFVGCALLATMPAVVGAQDSAQAVYERVDFAIPEGRLGDALNRFVRQSGVELRVDPAQIVDYRNERVAGLLTPREALERIVEGTGLIIGETAPGVLVLAEPGTLDRVAEEDAPITSRVTDRIVVIGRRGSLLDSLARKRGAANTADVLSADAAGRFPDNNAAEALRRLPGVTFQRETDTGEGEFISIRGLDSALNSVSYDGILSGSAAAGSGNAAATRRAELDGIDAADIEEIRVNKSLLPEHEGVGIGGLVEIKTRSPLGDDDRFRLKLEARPSEFANDTGYRIEPDFTYNFSDNFAVRGSAMYRNRKLRSFEVDLSGGILPLVIPDFGVDFGDDDEDPLINSEGLLTHENADFTSEQLDFTVDDQVQETYRLGGAVEWQVNPSTNFILSGRWSRTEADITETTLELDTDDDYEINPATGLSELVLDDQEVTAEGEIEDEVEENAYLSFRGETQIDRWLFEYNAGAQRIFEEQPILISIDFQTELPTQAGIAPLINNPVETPLPIVNDELLAILNDLGSTEIFDYDSEIADEQESWVYESGFDTTYESTIPWLPRIQAGALARRQETERLRIDIADTEDSVGNITDLNLTADGSLDPNDPSTDFFLSDTGLFTGAFYDFDDISSSYSEIGIPGAPIFDRERLLAFARRAIADNPGLEETNFTDATEDIFATYIQGEFELDGLTIFGGVRVEYYDGEFSAPRTSGFDADFDATGEEIDFEGGSEAEPERLQTTTDNIEFLPRIQANWRLGASEQWVVRGAYYTSLARPSFNALASETDIDLNLDFETGTPATATLTDLDDATIDVDTGNPDLENAYANNFDAGVEYYFENGSAITVGAFYKSIDNFIYVTEDANFGTEGLPEGFDLETFIANIPLNEEGEALIERLGGPSAIANFDELQIDVSRPRNGRTAEVYGVEIGFGHLFQWLPDPFDGLGLASNLTLLESEAEVELGVLDEDDALVILGAAEEGEIFTREVPFFNSPETAFMANLFYDKGPYEVSLTYYYQDAAINSLDDFGIDQYDASFEEVDLSAEYDLSEGLGLGGNYKLWLRVSDLTDDGSKFSSFQTFGKDGPNSDFASYNGREWRIGISGTF